MNLGGKDLNLLVALRVLLEEGNVTRAGQRIGVAQSEMSASLGKLRRHYHDELLIRVGRDFELTPLARMLLPQVQRALPLVEQAFAVAPEFDPASDRRIFSVLLSDYAMVELQELFTAVGAVAPGMVLDMQPLPMEASPFERDLLEHDFFVGPPAAGLDGESSELFRDRYVCVLDPSNPRLRDGRLSWSDFCDLPKAAPNFGSSHRSPVERTLAELGEPTRAKVITHGMLALPWMVAGTDLVAVVPSRLAARACSLTRTVAVEAPFGPVELIEMLWWHPTRDSDVGHSWLRTAIAAATAARPAAALGMAESDASHGLSTIPGRQATT